MQKGRPNTCHGPHVAQVLGHSKTILVLLGGWLFLGDIITARQAAGMALAVLGMVAYGVATSQCVSSPFAADSRRGSGCASSARAWRSVVLGMVACGNAPVTFLSRSRSLYLHLGRLSIGSWISAVSEVCPDVLLGVVAHSVVTNPMCLYQLEPWIDVLATR